MLDLTETVTEKFLEKTKEKAQALELAKTDYHEIMLKLLRERSGVGFDSCLTGMNSLSISCTSCGTVTHEVSWRCPECDHVYMPRDGNNNVYCEGIRLSGTICNGLVKRAKTCRSNFRLSHGNFLKYGIVSWELLI